MGASRSNMLLRGMRPGTRRKPESAEKCTKLHGRERAAVQLQVSWSHVPNIAMVADFSNIPPNDICNYSSIGKPSCHGFQVHDPPGRRGILSPKRKNTSKRANHKDHHGS